MDVADAMRIGCVFGFGEKGGAFPVGFEHGVEQAHPARRGFLRHASHPRAGGQRDVAAIGMKFALDQLEQRRLARARQTGEKGERAGRQLETDVAQHFRAAAIAHTHIFEADHAPHYPQACLRSWGICSYFPLVSRFRGSPFGPNSGA